MKHLAARHSAVLATHPGPILCAGLAAATRQQVGFAVLVPGSDNAPPGPPVDLAIADVDAAVWLGDGWVRCALGLPGEVGNLALTSSDREADIRWIIEARVHGYQPMGGGGRLGERAVAPSTWCKSISAAHRMADGLKRTALTSREAEVLLATSGQPNRQGCGES